MGRPTPSWLYHFTHVDHVESIVRDGLVCDTTAQASGQLAHEVGNREVKERRRARVVDTAPGGVVADYVPFYFTARSLMLYQIHTGKVPSYRGGQNCLVYLCTTLERVVELGLPWVASNRNASTAIARFTADLQVLDGHVDWPLATTSTFNRTPEDPERPRRHQAELLVHRRLPWEAVKFVGVRDRHVMSRVEATLVTLAHQPERDVRPDWYF
ncbi:MAG: DUF4433 domain-containing protein [Austwickia sp.]|nr:DUF4433 domain-containing protein [Austwickia sp.]